MKFVLNGIYADSTEFTLFTGNVLSVLSFSGKQKVKVLLPTGRHKEFDTDGIEMQEGDSVQFVIIDNDKNLPIKNVYIKNVTTNIDDVAECFYFRSGAILAFIFALIACGGFGIYKINADSAYLIGTLLILISGAVLIGFTQMMQKYEHKVADQFKRNILDTGVIVSGFKKTNFSLG